MIALALVGVAAQLLLVRCQEDMARPLTAKDVAGHSGQTMVPSGLVEDLLHAPIYYGMGGIPDESGIRGCRDALGFAKRAAQLIEYARTHGLQPQGPMPDAAEIQRIGSSGLSWVTLGGVPGRIQLSHLRPSSLEFLKRNLRAAEALIEDNDRRWPHTQRQVDLFFTITDCDFYTMASEPDAQAALDEIQNGKDVRQAIWDHQDMYADDRGAAFGTIAVSYWTDSTTRNAIQGLKFGEISKPIDGPYVTLIIPRAHLARNPYSSGEPSTPDERERLYRVLTAAERIPASVLSVPFQWTSSTASLIDDAMNMGMENSASTANTSQTGANVNGDEVRRRTLGKAISLLDAGDLPEFAERLAVYYSRGTKTELASLQTLAKRSDNADIEARLGKCYAQAGDAKQSANCLAKACRMPVPSYGIAYRSPLQDHDISELLSSPESWRIDPKDRSVLEQTLAASAAQRHKWDEARAHPRPLSAEDRERQGKFQEFAAYSKELLKAQRNRELAYYRDKIAYLSDRLTHVSADAVLASEAERPKAKTVEEEVRQKRDRAVSRLNILKQQTRG